MNREILFRGKRLDNGEWVTGRVITDDRDGKEFIVSSIGYHWEEDNGSTNRCMECFGFEVDPETVGQYTGLRDKNGVKIFEGDIVGAFLRTQIFEVKWCAERGGYFLDDVECCGGYEPSTECLGNMLHTIEVVGNIHDNPELLGVLGDGKK